MSPEHEVDLIVVGAGAAGMTAAIVAASHGLSVELLERADVIGGTTAISAGSVWIPNTRHAAQGSDSVERARTYLRATVGSRLRDDLCEAFLASGPETVEWLETNSALRLRPYAHHPDYFADAQGATLAGRVLEAHPFDGRRLGRRFRLLRAPLPEFTLFGGMMVDRHDIAQLLSATRRAGAAAHAMRLLVRYGVDRLSHRRGTRLVMGNALAGRLLASVLARGVGVRTRVEVIESLVGDARLEGLRVRVDGNERRIRARRGIVLASGGFSRDPVLREALLPKPVARHSPLVESVAGDGVRLGLAAGGRLVSGVDGESLEHDARTSFWAPVSIRHRRDRSIAVFPHFVLDRGKPGLLAIDVDGRRFVNEATPYNQFGQAIHAARRPQPGAPCRFVCNHRFVLRYGLGMVRPGGHGIRTAVAEGYLVRADSLEALARAMGIDAGVLRETVARHDAFARQGVDEDFGKGGNAYQRNLGDPSHRPNPCLGELGEPPYYALEVHAGDIGASAGLQTDADARVLDGHGSPIAGLYACGNDMASMMAGVYPGPGITIGPAMVFAYRAAKHVAAIAKG
ncbi:MAG: FAD-dependent oxidoreductase [Burkholderiaceae bacterium]|nr:FAD-dependent oxidoreductase [Burkholderiaceae bacterium]